MTAMLLRRHDRIGELVDRTRRLYEELRRDAAAARAAAANYRRVASEVLEAFTEDGADDAGTSHRRRD